LNSNGLIVMQPINANESGNMITTNIIDADSGDIVTSDFKLPNNPDPQKMGSIITYYRRYALQSMLGLQAEDDDGNKGSEKTVHYDKPLNSPVKKPVPAGSPVPTCECGQLMILKKDGTGYYHKHSDGTWGKPKTWEKPKSEAEKKFESELDASMYGG